MSRSYQVSLQPTVLQHGQRAAVLMLRDSGATDRELDALVASGDCLITLATALDSYAERLPVPAPEVQTVVNNLLYLQRHYRLSPKPAEYRQ